MDLYEDVADNQSFVSFEKRHIPKSEVHFHRTLEFIFIESGEVEATVDGEKRLLSAGEGCFADSFRVHSFAENPDSVGYVVMGHPRLFSFEGEYSFPRFFSFADFGALDSLLKLYRLPKKKENREKAFEGVALILSAYLSEALPREKRTFDKQSRLICEILSYAKENYAEDLSLAALSERFSYSREQLSRLLHKYLPVRWTEYVNQFRVNQAEKLLAGGTDETIASIAYGCGFDSPNTFYRAYKKAFGKFPRKKSTNDTK